MNGSILYLCVFLAAAAASASDAHPQSSHHSAYASEAKSDIASLSADELSQLESGAGMGFARAAELNSYPDRCTFWMPPTSSGSRNRKGRRRSGSSTR